MIIQIREDIYINTDAIIAITFHEDLNDAPGFTPVRNALSGPGAIITTKHHGYSVPSATALALLELLDVNRALILSDNSATGPEAPSLQTQIAQLMRDTWKGVTFEQLEAILPDAGPQAIADAMSALKREHVIIGIPRDGQSGLWYHCSSAEAQEYLREQREREQRDSLMRQIHFNADIDYTGICGFTANGLATTGVLALVTCPACRYNLGLDLIPSPDPSGASVAPPDEVHPVVADSEQTIDRKNEN